jgi:hypothetical protein
MEDSKWERYAALGGVLFVVLNLVGTFLPGAPPALDDGAAKIATYFKDNDTMIMAAQALAGFGTIGLVWWFGSLFRRMRAAEGGNPRLSVIALLGLALAGSCALISGAINSAAAMRIDDIGQGAIVFYALSTVVIGTSGFGIVAFLGAVCALNYRTNMFPNWISYLGWVAAAAFAIGSLSSASDATALGLFGLVGFLIWCVWILAISMMMWRETAVTS